MNFFWILLKDMDPRRDPRVGFFDTMDRNDELSRAVLTQKDEYRIRGPIGNDNIGLDFFWAFSLHDACKGVLIPRIPGIYG